MNITTLTVGDWAICEWFVKHQVMATTLVDVDGVIKRRRLHSLTQMPRKAQCACGDILIVEDE